ncbi:MAG TPA: diaminopimelate decarboxylase [Marinobacter hydrocarbonoclasticus]|nr:diaminopimelate decarboxylase [Marinobacter nauticus]
MDHFNYQSNALHAENVSVQTIAETHGTPCFIYSRATLERHLRVYQEAMEDLPHLICFAVKANSNLAVLNVLGRMGAGFDIVSGGELERVIAAGGDPGKVIFSGLGKSTAEIEQALHAGIRCFNVESEAELTRINEIALAHGTQAPVSIRVNPDVDAGTHPYISTGLKENKFGIDIAEAPAVYARAASLPNLDIHGVDCHIGSQLTSVSPFLDALDRVLSLIDTLAEQGIRIRHLDMGGGLGVTYNQETPPQPADYVKALNERLGDRELDLVLEPGRSIAANAGILVTRVEFLKCTEHRNFAIIDAAMNDLIRPALYSAWQAIIPVRPHQDSEERPWDLVGPVCETGDFLGKDRALRLKAGDLLAVRSAGAYGFVMASNYNTRNRPPELMVDGDQVHVVRRRETLDDQLAPESCLPE